MAAFLSTAGLAQKAIGFAEARAAGGRRRGCGVTRDTGFTFARKSEQIHGEVGLDGNYVLRTSASAEALPTTGPRATDPPDPPPPRRPRVRAHVLLCMLAELGTLTSNTIRLPGTDATFDKLTEPSLCGRGELRPGPSSANSHARGDQRHGGAGAGT